MHGGGQAPLGTPLRDKVLLKKKFSRSSEPGHMTSVCLRLCEVTAWPLSEPGGKGYWENGLSAIFPGSMGILVSLKQKLKGVLSISGGLAP